MQLSEAERGEALVLGGITVATWVLVIVFSVVVSESRRSSDEVRARAVDVEEALRRLPASRPEVFHVEQRNEGEKEEDVGPD